MESNRLRLTRVLAGDFLSCHQQSHKVLELTGPQRSSCSIPYLTDGKLRSADRKESFLEHLQAWWQILSLSSFPCRSILQMKPLRPGKLQAPPKATRPVVVELKWDTDPHFPVHSPHLSRYHVVSSLQEEPYCDKSFLKIKKSLKIQHNHSHMEKLQALWWRGLPREFPRSACDIWKKDMHMPIGRNSCFCIKPILILCWLLKRQLCS